MNYILKSASFLCLLVTFFLSCSKQDASLNLGNTPASSSEFKLSNVKFENGMLVFNTRADMDSAFKVVQRGQATVSDWLYKQFPGFVSQVTALNALTTQDSVNIVQASTISSQYSSFARKNRNEGVDFVDRVIENNILGNLVNKAGFIGYAGKVIKINYDYTYEISKDAYLQSPNKDVYSLTLAKIDPVTHNIHYSKEANTANLRFNVDYFTYNYYVSPHTLKQWSGIMYENNYFFGHLIEATTRVNFPGGNLDQAQYLQVSGNFQDQYGNTFDFLPMGSSDVGIISTSSDISIQQSLVGWHTTHYDVDYDGVSHYGYLNR